MKLLKYGLCTVKNEEQGIRSWIKMLDYFCDKIIALVDPDTNDNTLEILESMKQYHNLEIVMQDRSLGDADNNNKGKSLIMHKNKSKWINENISIGDWFIEIAVDERFSLHDYDTLEKEVKFAQDNGYDCIAHRDLIEPYPISKDQLEYLSKKYFVLLNLPFNNNNHNYEYCINWDRSEHIRFQCKIGTWKQNDLPHHGFSDRGKILYSVIPIYHFHRIKNNTQLPDSWRDKKGSIGNIIKKGKMPIIPMRVPFKDWRD